MSTRIAFSTSKESIVSKIIRWFTKSRTSHCFLVYYDLDFDRDMVMESTEGGYKITPFSKYESSLVAIFEPKQSIDVGLKKSVDWLEEDYDYSGLIGMAWVCLGKFLKRKWNNPFCSSKSMFCSEAVVKVLQLSNYPGSEQFDASSTSPEDLLKFFE
jgi:hypothetical protein